MVKSTRVFRKPLVIVLLLGAFLLYPIHSTFCDVIARYSAEFMAGGGARALAMGNAHIALASDAWAIFWNPAGLSKITVPQAALMHSERFEGVIDYDVAALALPQPDGSVISTGIIRLGVNGIPFTEKQFSDQPLSDENRVEITKIVNEGEYAYFAAKANHFGRWSWGISPKLIFKHIGSKYRAYGLGIDMGIRGKPLESLPVEAGLAIHDLLGTPIAWEQTGHKEIIVSTIRLGLACQFDVSSLEAQITPAVDLSYRLESAFDSDAADYHLGLEYLIRHTVALRVGSDNGRLAFGGGLQLKPVSIDYAFIGHDKLGDTHRISITARWGRN